ncbi:hypothetical protein Taro_021863 [Colocasia esculenta]|uniref:Aminotransferase-like plant mobile domain-containing protein n=1 Tax=Colocasia esculenta TaxID=4460 RepID=A0A843V6M5_COLES|nr:hypothetical protein [Colocasia esculenta]
MVQAVFTVTARLATSIFLYNASTSSNCLISGYAFITASGKSGFGSLLSIGHFHAKTDRLYMRGPGGRGEVEVAVSGVADQGQQNSGPPSPLQISKMGFGIGSIVRKAASAASEAAKHAYASATRKYDAELLPLKCCLMSVSLPWEYIAHDLLFKHVIYMGVDDGVFVPPSDITQHGDYIDVRNEVFVPPFDIYRIGVFVPPPDIYRPIISFESTTGYLFRCRTTLPLRVSFSLTTEDLNENAGSHVTTCGDFARTRRRKARTRRTEHQRQPETSSPALADQSSELRGPNRPGERFSGAAPTGVHDPTEVGGTSVEAGRTDGGLMMPRARKRRGESGKASRHSEDDVERTDDPMPCFTLSPIREEDLGRLDSGIGLYVLGPLEEPSPLEGMVDASRIDRSGRIYRYRRGDDYPKHFPLDEHLFPFIQNFVPANWEGPADLLAIEQVWAILSGRDSMMGTCSLHYPSFPLGYDAQVHFPDATQLGLFRSKPTHRVGEVLLAQGLWEVHRLPKTGPSFTGHTLSPSGPEFVQEGYDRSCFLDRILSGGADRWSVASSHRFCFDAIEWLMGILYHYHKLLDQIGILYVVVAALHDYPCHSGLLQALAERFNRRFNTFGIAEGETCLDLWALHRISGLPISGQLYEEICLGDPDRDQSSGSGSYILSHSFRYLARVWRDLARCGKSGCPSASKGTVRVSCDAWIRFFYNGPLCFHKGFAGDSYNPADYMQLSVSLDDNAKYLYAPRGDNWNPRRLPDRTYLAAYLVYWLCTFVLPFGEEGNIRPEVIYPACILVGGVRPALAPAALANIFHGLGDLTASSSPRNRNVVLATHYLSAWVSLLLPELSYNISLESPSMPLIFMFRNRPEQEQRRQLSEARRRLSFVPTAGQQGLDLACCSRDFRPWVEEDRRGQVYRLPHNAVPSASFRKDWLCCIRPSVLLFRKGGSLFMEPYFPHGFACNFGYDQAVPSNADFALSARTYKGLDRHLAFRERAERIKKVEGDYLSRAGAPISTIAPDFLQKEFSEIAGTVATVGRRRARAQAAGSADCKAYVGALDPLVRPESSLATSRDSGEPPLVYFWWRHFLLDCGYPVDAALSSPILPDLSRDWERHIRHSIARVGPRKFISWIESGTILQHFWDAIAEAGKAVKVSFDRVVLPPTFSQAPCESFILLTEMPKRDASHGRKRRASREAGPSQPAARGRTPDPSSSAGVATSTPGGGDVAEDTPRDNVVPQVDDDYNPTFDGTSSPDGAGTSQASPTGPGYIPADAIAAEGVEHPAAIAPVVGGTPSLQAIHDLLMSGSESELPGFSDFAPSILEGGGWQRALHSAMAVTSAAVLPTASPPEEGEVARGAAGDGDDGAEIAAEMMEAGPPEAIPPPTVAVGGAEDAPRRIAPALFLPGASELPPGGKSDALVEGRSPVAVGESVGAVPATEGGDDASFPPDTQAIGNSLLPPSSSEVSLEGPDAFPRHDILWPDVPQEGLVRGVEGMLSLFMTSARAVMEESSPPSVEAVRGVLRRSTLAYHLMGCPRDPWMAAVDALWGEVRVLDSLKFNRPISFIQARILKDFNLKAEVIVKAPILVRWIPPVINYSINVDGACKGNPGACGGGGCFRDVNDDFVFGFAYFYGTGNSLMAETRAIHDGLRFIGHGTPPECLALLLRSTLDSLLKSRVVPDLILATPALEALPYQLPALGTTMCPSTVRAFLLAAGPTTRGPLRSCLLIVRCHWTLR